MSENNFDSFLKGFLFGVTGGVVAGILLAPKSGAETREDIKNLTLDFKEKATDFYYSAKKEVERKITQIKKAGEKIDESKYKKIVGEVVDEFKQNTQVTASAAKKLGEQLGADWGMVKKELVK